MGIEGQQDPTDYTGQHDKTLLYGGIVTAIVIAIVAVWIARRRKRTIASTRR